MSVVQSNEVVVGSVVVEEILDAFSVAYSTVMLTASVVALAVGIAVKAVSEDVV